MSGAEWTQWYAFLSSPAGATPFSVAILRTCSDVVGGSLSQAWFVVEGIGPPGNCAARGQGDEGGDHFDY